MKKFSFFLLVALGITAFLVGYLIFDKGLGGSSGLKTGTILDKFNQQSTPDKQGADKGNVPFLIADRAVISPTNSSKKSSVFYFEKNTGKMFEFSLETRSEEVVLNEVVPNFLSALWSPRKGETIRYFYSPSGNRFEYYNFDTLTSSGLDKDIQSIAFSPDGNLTVHYHLDSTGGTDQSGLPADQIGLPAQAGKIVISQPNGQYPKKIFQARIKELQLSWPVQDRIVIKTPSELFFLTEDGKLTKLLESNFSLEEKWSPSGKKLLLSSFTDMTNPEIKLRVMDIESKIEKLLDITLPASRCVWSIDDVNIVCASPRSSSSDEFYRINTFTGSVELIAELELMVKDFFLSTTEDYIIFTNASDEKLYGIRIGD